MIYDLKPVAVNVELVYESNILAHAVISFQDLYVIFLNAICPVLQSVDWAGYALCEKSTPFVISERVIIEGFELPSEVSDEVFFFAYLDVFVALFTEHTDKFGFKFCFCLEVFGVSRLWGIFSYYGFFICLCYYAEQRHLCSLLERQ